MEYLLKNLKALGLTALKPKHLIFFCNIAWPPTNWVTRRSGPGTDFFTLILSSKLTFTVAVLTPYFGFILKSRQDSNLQQGFQGFRASFS